MYARKVYFQSFDRPLLLKTMSVSRLLLVDQEPLSVMYCLSLKSFTENSRETAQDEFCYSNHFKSEICLC